MYCTNGVTNGHTSRKLALVLKTSSKINTLIRGDEYNDAFSPVKRVYVFCFVKIISLKNI